MLHLKMESTREFIFAGKKFLLYITSSWQVIHSLCVWVLTCGHVEVGSGSGWCCSVWRPAWDWSCIRPPWWSLCHEPSFHRLDMRRRSFTEIQQWAVQRSSFRAAQEAQEVSQQQEQQQPSCPTRPRHAAVCAERSKETHTNISSEQNKKTLLKQIHVFRILKN